MLREHLPRQPAAAGRPGPASEGRGAGPPGLLWRSLSLRGAEAGISDARSSQGVPLEPATRNRWETAFGTDFSEVRVHDHAGAASEASALGAAAFTSGRDIVFGAGRYAPDTRAGSRLLAHELAHVVQQRGGKSGEPTVGASQIPSDAGREQEANEVAELSAAGLPVSVSAQGVSGPQRQTVGEADPPSTSPYDFMTDIDREEAARQKAVEQEEKALAVASERGRAVAQGGATEAMTAASAIIYRLLHLRFPSFVDSVTGVGLGEAMFFVKVEPEAGGQLDRDQGFSITVDRRFLEKPLYLQEYWLEVALSQLPSLSGPGPGSYQNALVQAGKALEAGPSGFGSMTGSAGGEVDAGDAYDASTWQEVSKKVIRTTVEPSRAMRRMVDSFGKDVPKAGGGTTRWRMDCFDAVVFAQVYARWKTMSRFAFNQQYFPLELGFGSTASRTEWQEPVQATSKGGPRFVVNPEKPAGELTGSGHYSFEPEETTTPVKESWETLVREAPAGSQVVWKNFDAERRCRLAAQRKLPEPGYCESWQAENAIKVGEGQYLAFPLGDPGAGHIVNEAEILDGLAEAALEEIPAWERLPKAEYIRRHIGVSMVRRPKP